MTKRRKFSPEFKRGAIDQASQLGVTCAQVARELGINPNQLSRWKREAEKEGRHAFGGSELFYSFLCPAVFLLLTISLNSISKSLAFAT